MTTHRNTRSAFGRTLFLITLLLLGCSRKAEQLPGVEPVTIRMAMGGYQQPLYEELVDLFAETNPDIRVELVLEDDILGRTSSGGVVTASTDDDLILAREADVFRPLSPRFASETGALLDLSPFIAAERDFDSADFYPGLLEQFRWQGRTWAIPTEGNYDLIYFNKDLFDAASVAYPQPGWSWDDFLAAAIALTVSEGEQTTQWGFLDPFARSLYFVQGRSGPLVDLEANPTTARVDNPAVAKAVGWYADLFQVYQVTQTFEYMEAERLIRNGRVAMWVYDSGLWTNYPPSLHRGAVPFPADASDERTTPIGYMSALGISAGTRQPQAAWRWLSFLSRQAPVQPPSFEHTFIPARRSVAAASNFWEQVDEALRPALEYAVEHAYVPVRVRGFEQAVGAVIAGEQSVDQALAHAQTVAETWLAEQQQATPGASVVMSAREEGGEEGSGVTIAFKVSDTSLLPAYRTLAAAFHTANPGVSVDVSAADLAGGQPGLQGVAAEADCFQAAPAFDEAGAQAVLSLEPFFDADPSLRKADFFPQAIDAFTYQGQLRGLPGEISVSVVEYNRDLVDAAGVAYPAAGWSLDDFLQAAVALTHGSGGEKQYGFVPDLYEPGSLVDFLALWGAPLVDTAVDPPVLNFTHPGVVAAVQWYVDLTERHEVKPLLMTAPEGDAWAAYEEREALINGGRAAMWLDSGGFAGGVAVAVSGGSEAGPERIGVAPLPSGPDGVAHGSYRATGGAFISAQSRNPEACWQWLAFLSGQPEVVRGLPARRSVAESTAYRQQVGEERASAYLATVEAGAGSWFFQPFAEHPWLQVAFSWLAGAYDQAVRDGVPVEEALAKAQQKAAAFRECLAARDGFQDWNTIQACLMEAGNE